MLTFRFFHCCIFVFFSRDKLPGVRSISDHGLSETLGRSHFDVPRKCTCVYFFSKQQIEYEYMDGWMDDLE